MSTLFVQEGLLQRENSQAYKPEVAADAGVMPFDDFSVVVAVAVAAAIVSPA